MIVTVIELMTVILSQQQGLMHKKEQSIKQNENFRGQSIRGFKN